MIKPAGNAITKYAMKTAESIKDDCNVVKLKDFFKCGMRIGSRLWTNPHIKKREVIIANANLVDADVWLIAIVSVLFLSFVNKPIIQDGKVKFY